MCTTLFVELCSSRSILRPVDFLPWAGPMIMHFNIAVFIAAVQRACESDAEPKRKKTRLYTKPTMQEVAGMKEAVKPGHHKHLRRSDKELHMPKLSDALNPKIAKRELEKLSGAEDKKTIKFE